MEISSVLFSLALVVLSAVIVYQCGIKPEREERRRKAEQLLAEIRRQRGGRLAMRDKLPNGPNRATSSPKLSRPS